jgi:hypothetical protein
MLSVVDMLIAEGTTKGKVEGKAEGVEITILSLVKNRKLSIEEAQQELKNLASNGLLDEKAHKAALKKLKKLV